METKIAVCVCTYQRPQMLRRLLIALKGQSFSRPAVLSVVVCDNDAARSAESIVSEMAASSPLSIKYCHEPRKNIALARNQTISTADGDFIAFVDDDEFPEPDWLDRLLESCERFGAAGVLGPVKPHFEYPPPDWLIKGRFCDRPEYPTGTEMKWEECRTGNVLFRRSILISGEPPFDPNFGTGGEDKDFFMRATGRGHKFIWCNEAVVHETVPPARWTREYMLKRALLRGRNILKHPIGRTKAIATSLIAAPIYVIILPVSLLFGQHHFMKYCIKFCDHSGRILAVMGLNRVSERQM